MAVYSLNSVAIQDVGLVGGKAASLGELLKTKQRIPAGFIVGADEQTMSPSLEQAILHHFDALRLTRVAVRSSGIEEDGHEKSWAGQFATVLNVDRAGLIEAVKTCWGSATSGRARAYGKTAKLAVLIQQMVQSDIAGVAFSADPVTGNKNHVVVEAVYGLCEPLVSGTATPDHFVVDKSSGKVIDRDITNKSTMLVLQDGKNAEIVVARERQLQPALSDAQLQEVTRLVGAVEAHYGFPVDIEWAYQTDVLYLLQARPITTL